MCVDANYGLPRKPSRYILSREKREGLAVASKKQMIGKGYLALVSAKRLIATFFRLLILDSNLLYLL